MMLNQGIMRLPVLSGDTLTTKVNEHFAKCGDDYDISSIVTEMLGEFIHFFFTTNLEESLINSYGDISNLSNKITKRPFVITVSFAEFCIDISEVNGKITTKCSPLKKPIVCRKSQRHRRPKDDTTKVTIYFNTELQFANDLRMYVLSLYSSSIQEIHEKIRNVYYLPASRSGLYRALNAFSQILVELSKKRSFLQRKIVLPSISEQDSDYFSKINEINLKRVSAKYNPVATLIEQRLLKGSVMFDPQSKQIMFKPNNGDITLELLGTSSMIAEVSPIVLYLKYIIGSDEEVRRKRDINPNASPVIFIEEPEAHLHPEAQIELIECFVELIKQGARLVITSHSNYIFSKLNNLIASQKIDSTCVKGYQIVQDSEGSFCKEILMSQIGMNDENFVNVSEQLYSEKIQIIESME